MKMRAKVWRPRSSADLAADVVEHVIRTGEGPLHLGQPDLLRVAQLLHAGVRGMRERDV